jgi:asparagine synthase (glutamine-hydrolysing)
LVECMPGIAGVVNIATSEDTLQAMLKRMTFREDYAVSQDLLQGKNIALGKTDIAILRKPAIKNNKNFTLFFDGEIYDENIIAPEVLLQGDQYKMLKSLKGSFAFACLDAAKNLLNLVSDKFGSRPLYYSSFAGGFVFASEIKALLALSQINKKPNLQAFADCYHFGFVLGDKTLFSDIHLLPPGSILTYDIKTGNLSITQYWQLHDIFPAKEQDGELSEVSEVASLFGEAVNNRLGQLESIGVSLSGGLDSRAILAAMKERAKGVHSYTLGLPGCQDEKLSARLARVAGTLHSFLEIGPEHLGDFLELAETLIYLSDGLYHPHESTEKRALDYFRNAPFRIVLRGHGGEIAKASLAYPVQVNEAVSQKLNHEQVIDFIYDSANLVLRDIDPHHLFQPAALNEMKNGARQSLTDSMKQAGDKLSSADQCIYFYIQEWIRRQVFASLAIFRTQTEIRLPYLDEDFLGSLLKLPLKKRYAGEVHVEIIRRFFPQMIKINNSNTGAPLDAGKTRLYITDKLNVIMKRLSLPGFRHYTEFQQWQRQQFRKSIETILFDPKTLARDLYNPLGLRNVFDSHVKGNKNYAHLLGTIVGLELWFRKFVD